MEIRGVGGINPLDKHHLSKNTKISSTVKTTGSDSLKLSEDARFLEDEAFVKEILAKIPDIDHKKIDSVKKKIENGDYNNKETIDRLTDKLLQSLGF